MEILQLKYFKLVAELENMSQAAKELNIVQSAVSRSVKRLEEELGADLFDRVGKSIQLNLAGRVAYTKAVEILETIDQMKSDIKLCSSTKTPIHIVIEAASGLIPDLIAKYKTIKSDSDFIIHQTSDSRKCDLRISSTSIDDQDYDGQPLFTEEIKFLIPKKLLQDSHDKSIEVIELQNIPFIGLKDSYQLRRMTDDFGSRIGLFPKYVFESDNPSMLRSMIQSGLGAVYYPVYSWGDYDENYFSLLSIGGNKLKRLVLIHKEGSDIDINLFYDYILKELKA